MNTGLKLKENEVVHCKTEKQANKVLKIAHKMGLKWSDGSSLLENNYWTRAAGNTCYNLNKGLSGSKGFYKIHGDSVITAKEFLKRHEEPTLKQRIEKLEAEREHSKQQCDLILDNVENKILNYLDHAKKQDERISKLEQQEKPIEELHAEHRDRRDLKVGDVVKAWDGDENDFIFGVLYKTKESEDKWPYKISRGCWYENAEHAPEEVVKHFKK